MSLLSFRTTVIFQAILHHHLARILMTRLVNQQLRVFFYKQLETDTKLRGCVLSSGCQTCNFDRAGVTAMPHRRPHHHHRGHAPDWSIAVSTSCFHRSRSWASRQAEFRPWLSGWRSASMVHSQVRRGRPGRRLQSLGNPRIDGSGRVLRIAHLCHVPEETEPSCLDERQQLRWRASSESYFSSSCMGCIGNSENTSETRVVKGSNPVFQSSGQGPCFRTVEEDRSHMYTAIDVVNSFCSNDWPLML